MSWGNANRSTNKSSCNWAWGNADRAWGNTNGARGNNWWCLCDTRKLGWCSAVVDLLGVDLTDSVDFTLNWNWNLDNILHDLLNNLFHGVWNFNLLNNFNGNTHDLSVWDWDVIWAH